MWTKVVAYFTFLCLSFKQLFPPAKYRSVIRGVWGLIIFVLGFIVADYFGIPLKQIVLPIYHLLPALWWIIIVLVLAAILLLFVINGARRIHEKTLNEVYAANEATIEEYLGCAANIERWTLFKGRFDVLQDLLDFRSWPGNTGDPLTREEIERHEADFHNWLQDRRGADWTQDYFASLGEIPESLRGQMDRMRVDSDQCHRIIREEQVRQQSIAAKANKQRHDLLTLHRGKMRGAGEI